MAPQPLRITRSDPSRIAFEWDDGRKTVLSTVELRALCPCAACVDELTGVRRHDPRTVAPTIEHSNVRLVGNYALTMRFSDGHDTGIFTFPMLLEHGHAE